MKVMPISDQQTEIGACFWNLSDEAGDDVTVELSKRIRSDGTDVEVIDVEELSRSLSLDALPYGEARSAAVAYPIVRLQKHGIVTIVDDNQISSQMLSKLEDQLEKLTFIVDSSVESESLQHTFECPEGESSGEIVDALMDYGEDRGLFAEGVSDQRSDEEVTDRLKNLGYI
jgi:hypothetical protein